MAFYKNALMCNLKKVKLLHRDCLPILMLLYIMLYIMLVNLMLLVCIMLFLLTVANALCFCELSWVIDTICLFHKLFCIMHSALNLLVFVILCSHRFFMKGLYALLRNST